MRQFRLENNKMTVGFSVDGRDEIVHAPNVVKRFIGSDYKKLIQWSKEKFNFTTIHVEEDGKLTKWTEDE